LYAYLIFLKKIAKVMSERFLIQFGLARYVVKSGSEMAMVWTQVERHSASQCTLHVIQCDDS